MAIPIVLYAIFQQEKFYVRVAESESFISARLAGPFTEVEDIITAKRF